jgi:hypothetical protein
MRPGNAAFPRWEEFVTRLERWQGARDHTFGRGGRCIGNTPWKGPQAFLHELYEPLDEAGIAAIEARVNARVEQQLRGFYLNANGAHLFHTISMHGLIGLIDRTLKGGIRQPISVDYGNHDERPRGLVSGDYVFGGIIGETVVGQLLMNAAGGGVRLVHPIDGTDVALTWPSFEDFLFAELDRLTLLHNDKGEFTGGKYDRLPPEAARWERKAK